MNTGYFPRWVIGLLGAVVLIGLIVKFAGSRDLEPTVGNPPTAKTQLKPRIQVDPRHVRSAPVNPPGAEPDLMQTLVKTQMTAAGRMIVAAQAGGIGRERRRESEPAVSPANSPGAASGQTAAPITSTVTMGSDLPADPGEKAQRLALAAANGDTVAVKLLEDLATTLRQAVDRDPRSLKQPGEIDSRERETFIDDSFKPIRDAIELLNQESARGNQNALDALISLASSTRPDVRNAAISGLQRAAANQNAKAAEALRKILPQ
jgi:hypothetical protein